MREFIVLLRSGVRYTVKADRVCVCDRMFMTFVVDPIHRRTEIAGESDGEEIGDAEIGTGDIVALFEPQQVFVVLSREHLVAEEKGEPILGPHIIGGGDPIPF